tara:strand:- start:15 stop:392 length:378 start_codon:yes stop_codon:yes gene_type:complete
MKKRVTPFRKMARIARRKIREMLKNKNRRSAMTGPGLFHLTPFLAQTELSMFMGCMNVGCKQRMREKRLGFEFRMELAGDEPGMICTFNGFYQIEFRIPTAYLHPAFLKHRDEMVHHLITVTMPF